jgi:uncharacterized protein
MREYNNREFKTICKDILELNEFNKLKDVSHHGISRYNHSMRVSYYTYLITKKLHLNYKKATRAALLHDFFTDEVKDYGGVRRLRRHPLCALENAKKYFDISLLEEDIITKHMFPVTFTPPKYLESWIVDIVDDVVSIYERAFWLKKEIKAVATFLLVLLIK